MIALVEPGHALKTAPHLRKWGVGLRGFLGVGLGLRGVGLGWGCEASRACTPLAYSISIPQLYYGFIILVLLEYANAQAWGAILSFASFKCTLVH